MYQNRSNLRSCNIIAYYIFSTCNIIAFIWSIGLARCQNILNCTKYKTTYYSNLIQCKHIWHDHKIFMGSNTSDNVKICGSHQPCCLFPYDRDKPISGYVDKLLRPIFLNGYFDHLSKFLWYIKTKFKVTYLILWNKKSK